MDRTARNLIFLTCLATILTVAPVTPHAAAVNLDQCDSICSISTDCEQSCQADLFQTTCGAYDGGVENGWCAGECGDDFCVLEAFEDLFSCHEDCYVDLVPKYFGVVSGTSPVDDCERVIESGVGSVRITAYWHLLQPDEMDPVDFDEYLDEYVDCVISEGIEVYMTLGSAPSWAGGGQTAPNDGIWHNNVPNYGDWQDFVETIIGHYSTEVSNGMIVFGIWNEPGDDKYLYTGSNKSVYGDLFAYADAARDTVNSSAVLAGPEALDDWEDYIDEIWGDMASQDIVSVHNYDAANLKSEMEGVADHAWPKDVWLTETGGKSPNQTWHTYTMLNNFVNDTPFRWKKTFLYVLWNGTNDGDVLIDNSDNKRDAYHVLRMFLGVPWPF